MSYRDFPNVLLVSLLCLTASPVTLATTDNSSDDDTAETASWAETVDTDGADLTTESGEPLDASAEVKRISKHVQTLKSEVIELNNDLRLMEEELLFPSSTQYSVFVSLSSGQFFALESVKLKLNGKLVATHVYSEKQRQAMLRGGIHRLYVTNLNAGDHTVTAFFTGVGPSGREYKRATNIDFEKDSVGKYLELAVGDDPVKQEPVFAIKQW